MTHRVGAKGQVVVPKAIRTEAGLEPGTEVEFKLGPEGVLVSPARKRPSLGGRYRRTGMAQRLLEDRAAEPR